MVYRELFNLRLKLLLWAIVFFGAALFYLASNTLFGPMPVTIYQENGQEMYNTLFGGWLKIMIIITPALAVFGAADVISEEVGKGTLSFLLTRPFSRTRIYITKVLLNTGVLLACATFSSLLVLLVDQLPRQVLILRWTTSPCGDNAYCSGWTGGNGLEPSRPAELIPSLVALGVILSAAILIVFGTGLLSIFTRSFIQTIATVLPLALLVYLVLTRNGPFARVSQYAPTEAELLSWTDTPARLLWLEGLVFLSGIVFLGGLVAFRRKEF